MDVDDKVRGIMRHDVTDAWMEHGTKWKSLQPGCINAGFRIL